MTFEVTYMKRFIEYARAEDFIRSIAPSHGALRSGDFNERIIVYVVLDNLLKTGKLIYLDPTHFQQLVSYYYAVYEEHSTYFGASDEHQGISVNDRIRKIRDVEILGQTLISSMSRQYRSNIVVSVVCRDPHDTSKKALRPANVLYYFQHCLEGVEHVFTYVE
ncbi:hypothetical protein VTP01DRAFT_959 [Rhizomucor pusillus]|uniref:uncharacterized protein n=1 Tax=Rhizomucor pusillus TaxID=4840 RepID=UPI0037430E03